MKIRSLIIQFVFLIAGALLLVLAFRGQNFSSIVSELKKADYRYVGCSLGVLLVAHYIRAIRWKMLIRPLGFNPSSIDVFSAVMIGYLANLAVPRMGEVSRCAILNRTDNAPVEKLLGTVITERIADVLMLLVLMAVTFICQYDLIAAFIHKEVMQGIELKTQNAGSFLLKSGIVLCIVIALVYMIYRSQKKFLLNLGPVKKMILLVKGIAEGVKSIRKMKHSWLFLFYSILIWGLYALSTGLVFYALPATSRLSLKSALYVLCAGSLGMVAPVQGGIGAYHFMVTQALFLIGIAKADGLAYATINHSSQLLLFLIAGGIFLVFILLIKPGPKVAANPDKQTTIPHE